MPWKATVASGISISIRCVQLAAPRSRSLTMADQPRPMVWPTRTCIAASVCLHKAQGAASEDVAIARTVYSRSTVTRTHMS